MKLLCMHVTDYTVMQMRKVNREKGYYKLVGYPKSLKLQIKRACFRLKLKKVVQFRFKSVTGLQNLW